MTTEPTRAEGATDPGVNADELEALSETAFQLGDAREAVRLLKHAISLRRRERRALSADPHRKGVK